MRKAQSASDIILGDKGGKKTVKAAMERLMNTFRKEKSSSKQIKDKTHTSSKDSFWSLKKNRSQDMSKVASETSVLQQQEDKHKTNVDGSQSPKTNTPLASSGSKLNFFQKALKQMQSPHETEPIDASEELVPQKQETITRGAGSVVLPPKLQRQLFSRSSPTVHGTSRPAIETEPEDFRKLLSELKSFKIDLPIINTDMDDIMTAVMAVASPTHESLMPPPIMASGLDARSPTIADSAMTPSFPNTDKRRQQRRKNRKKRADTIFERNAIRPDVDEISRNLDQYFPDIHLLKISKPADADSMDILFIERLETEPQEQTKQKLRINTRPSVIKGSSGGSLSPTENKSSLSSGYSEMSFKSIAQQAISANMIQKGRVTSALFMLSGAASQQLASIKARKNTINKTSMPGSPKSDIQTPSTDMSNQQRKRKTFKPVQHLRTDLIPESDESEQSPLPMTPQDKKFEIPTTMPQLPEQSELIEEEIELEALSQPLPLSIKPSKAVQRLSFLPDYKPPVEYTRKKSRADSVTDRIRNDLIQKAKSNTGNMVSLYKGDRIGRGAYGDVFIGLNLHTWEMMAIKEVDTARLQRLGKGKKIADITHEMEILQSLEHPNIVKFLGFEQEDGITRLFMEYVSGGSVGKTLARTGPLPTQLNRCITAQVLAGLEYLHSQKGIIQRDIKPDNILISLQCRVKISDFGISVKQEDSDVYRKDKTLSVNRGTPNFMAPETFRKGGYSAKVDIWSLGCTVIEMATGSKPWDKLRDLDIAQRLVEQESPTIEGITDEDTRLFIAQCLDFNPDTRPSATELRDHPFVTGFDPVGYPYANFVKEASAALEESRRLKRLQEQEETGSSSDLDSESGDSSD
ncbi:kinase-like domain-containing protein [Gorgonomyces haynaldii]|nr:kinase-like domain-containing protein [Gorgonomyces haynaldii]